MLRKKHLHTKFTVDPKNQTTDKRRCLYCGQLAPLVWVHGHGQCAACGINVEECCSGESCFIQRHDSK